MQQIIARSSSPQAERTMLADHGIKFDAVCSKAPRTCVAEDLPDEPSVFSLVSASAIENRERLIV